MSQKILVCVTEHPQSHTLCDAGHNKAQETGLPWQVVFVEPAGAFVQAPARRAALMRALEKARRAGAEIVHIDSSTPRKALLDFIQNAFKDGDDIRHIFIGEYSDTHARFMGLRQFVSFGAGSLAQQVARRFGAFTQVTSIPLEGRAASLGFWQQFDWAPLTWRTLSVPTVAVVLAFFVAEASKLLLPAIAYKLNLPNIALIFLLACVVVAIRFGAVPALLASAMSIAVINYEYVVPIHQFNIGTGADIISITIFMSAAVVVSFLGGHVRTSVDRARRREQHTRALYEINAITSDIESRSALVSVLQSELSKLLGLEVAFFTVKEGDALDEYSLPAHERVPADIALTEADARALSKCWQTRLPSGVGTLRGIGSFWYFEVMATSDNAYGVMGVRVPLDVRLEPGFGQIIATLADHAAAALDRLEVLAAMQESRFNEEREKLRSMLLSSVSHDLKTPLASVIGSISVLKSLRASGRLSEEHMDTLADTALEEAQRLDSFITNILSMTKLETGEIEFKCAPHNPVEALNRARKSLRTRLLGRTVHVSYDWSACTGSTDGDAVLVDMDAMMTTQVLQNVIDNAAKYSPAGSDIEVHMQCEPDGSFTYSVRDHGSGIPDGQHGKIFDKYERINKADSQVAGTGLGLAIARVVMEGQGGTISVVNHPAGGAVFQLHLPKAVPARTDGEAAGQAALSDEEARGSAEVGAKPENRALPQAHSGLTSSAPASQATVQPAAPPSVSQA